MQIILLKDVKGQGKKDSIIDVKDGYGNFLIKNKSAVMVTTTSVKRLETAKKQRKETFLFSCVVAEWVDCSLRQHVLSSVYSTEETTDNNPRAWAPVAHVEHREEAPGPGIDMAQSQMF